MLLFLLALAILSLSYIFYVSILFNQNKKYINTLDKISSKQRGLKLKKLEEGVRVKLLGLDIGSAFLIWGNIVLVLLTLYANFDLKIQNEKLHRPYIGLVNNVGVILDYATSTDDKITSSAMRLKLKIKNYGELPTSFTSQVDGWLYGEINTFQNSQDFIMPGQEVDLLWNLNHDKDISGKDCNFLNNLSVKINYPGHYVTVIPKFIDDPRHSKNDSNQKIYDFTVYGCKDKPQVLVWYVKEMK